MSGVNNSTLLKPTGSVRFVLDLHAYAAGGRGAHRRTYLQIPHGPHIDMTTILPKLTTKIGQCSVHTAQRLGYTNVAIAGCSRILVDPLLRMHNSNPPHTTSARLRIHTSASATRDSADPGDVHSLILPLNLFFRTLESFGVIWMWPFRGSGSPRSSI